MVSVRAFIAAGLGVIVIILIFLGLFSNGWVTAEWDEEYEETENSFSYSEGGELNIGLLEAEARSGSFSDTIDLSDAADSGNEDSEKIYNAGLTAYVILWLSLIVTIAGIVFAILGGLGITVGWPGVLIGFSAGVLLFLAVILYGVITPEFEEDINMGFGWCFYIIMLGGVIQCVGGGLMIGTDKERNRVHREPSYRHHGQEISGLGLCPNCDQSIEPGSDYCISCGIRFPSREPRQSSRSQYDGDRGDPYDRPPREHYGNGRERQERRETNKGEYESLYGTPNTRGKEHVSVLKGRLARGEITKQEYEELKVVIEE